MHRIPQLKLNRKNNHIQLSDTLFSTIKDNPIRIGLFYDGKIYWQYPHIGRFPSEEQPILSIISMNCSAEYEMIKFCLSTDQKFNQNVKIIVQYQNLSDCYSTAFYSPSESAIVYCAGEEQLVSLIGGSVNGRPMTQYCIHSKDEYNHLTLQDCLKRGQLPMSWLATGNICCTFVLEAEISSNSQAEGVVWSFHSNTEEQVKYRKKEMTSSMV